MKKLARFCQLLQDTSGASLVEYSLLVGLIAAAAVGGVTTFGTVVNWLYVSINNAI